MDIKEVKKRVRDIAKQSDDDEVAHSEEDGLRLDFIYHVAEAGSPELQAMAKEIIKVSKMDFARWCA